MSWIDIVLAWLLTRSGSKASERDLRRAFPELRGVDAWLERMSSQELIEQKGSSVLLTKRGSKAARTALASLGVKAQPNRLARDYLRQVVLPAKALGIQPDGLGLDGLRAAVLSRVVGRPARSLAQARDALLWKELGIESTQKFTVKSVSLALLGRRLGNPVTDVRRALDLVASGQIGVPGDLRTALRGKLLAALPQQPTTTSAAQSSTSNEPLPVFARRVLLAAAACTERFGEDRVYVSAVFQHLKDTSLSYPQFQERLVEANRTRALRLARADLVEAMPAELVRASETRGPADSTFHFVVLPTRTQP